MSEIVTNPTVRIDTSSTNPQVVTLPTSPVAVAILVTVI